MNGIHDMGGMDGFGKVEPEPDEPVFHAPWEGRVMAMMRAMGAAGAWNLDMFRDAREQQPPEVYLASSYYQSWLLGLETLALRRGYVAPEELAAGHPLHPARSLPRDVLRARDAPAAVLRGSYERPSTSPALFKAGDRVRTRNMHPTTHTRLPRYARGRLGVVERVLGCQVFPDSSALGNGEDPRWLYTVVFEGRELWGSDTDATLKISIDAFEPYLERA
ncbi:MAG TPA: nitrile hydratase subunit beta [Roseiarcus sp.]|jgi:nitrile hydratase|nr:nitrile hydratase subunit beta [Roseiarcus sp.]